VLLFDARESRTNAEPFIDSSRLVGLALAWLWGHTFDCRTASFAGALGAFCLSNALNALNAFGVTPLPAFCLFYLLYLSFTFFTFGVTPSFVEPYPCALVIRVSTDSK
jgi:hypothetical protein